MVGLFLLLLSLLFLLGACMVIRKRKQASMMMTNAHAEIAEARDMPEPVKDANPVVSKPPAPQPVQQSAVVAQRPASPQRSAAPKRLGPAPMLKKAYDGGAFARAANAAHLSALSVQEVAEFRVTDDSHGVFTINTPMATMTNDKQKDLTTLIQMGTGNRVSGRIENMQRNGMQATYVFCEVKPGAQRQQAVSPNRANSIRSYAKNIDMHGSAGITAGRAHTPERRRGGPNRV